MTDHLYAYLDDLLRLQSEAAQRHNHKGVLGTVCETFIIQILGERIDDIKTHTGEVCCETHELGQQDIIIRQRGTLNTDLGGQIRLDAKDCAGVIEVKSNAKGSDITNFDEKSKYIKKENPQTICGMVCYKLACRKETILNRAGFKYDSDIQGFVKVQNLEPSYLSLDFILCLDEGLEIKDTDEYSKSFFFKKGSEYELFLKPPFMKYFLNEVNMLANNGRY